MRVMAESTRVVTAIDGVPVRLWEATTEAGIQCRLFVHRVVVHEDEDQTAFEAELQSQDMPLELSFADALTLRAGQ